MPASNRLKSVSDVLLRDKILVGSRTRLASEESARNQLIMSEIVVILSKTIIATPSTVEFVRFSLCAMLHPLSQKVAGICMDIEVSHNSLPAPYYSTTILQWSGCGQLKSCDLHIF